MLFRVWNARFSKKLYCLFKVNPREAHWCILTSPVCEHAVLTSDHWLIHFAAYTAAKTFNAFQWAGQTQKLPIPVWGSRPHLKHGSLGPPKSAPKRHLDRFCRFSRVHPYDQHTSRQTTDHAKCDIVAIGRILCTACMRCGLIAPPKTTRVFTFFWRTSIAQWHASSGATRWHTSLYCQSLNPWSSRQ